MKRQLLLAIATIGLCLSVAAHEQGKDGNGDGKGHDLGHSDDSTVVVKGCSGCASSHEMGAVVSTPGYTIGIEPGNPNPDGSPYNPNGKCKALEGLCVQDKPCKPKTKYTFKAAQAVSLNACWYRQKPDGTWHWDCLVVAPSFSGSSSHVENEGDQKCGESLARKTILGPSSVTWKMKCSECE